MQPRAIAGVCLYRLGNPVHHRHGLNRPRTGGGFGGQHHRICAIIYCRCNVRHFGAGGGGGCDHRFEHLCCHDHRLAHRARGGDNALLRRRHGFGRQFHTQVPARHHAGIGEFENFFQPRQCLRLFKLHQHARPPVDQRARFGHIFGPLDKRQRNPVHMLIERKGEVTPILFGQRRQRHHNIGQVHALAVGNRAAHFDSGDHMVAMAGRYAQHQFAIVHQQSCTRLQRAQYFRVRQAHARGIAGLLIAIQNERRAFGQHHGGAGKAADAQFWPLQIRQYGGWTAQFLFQTADRRHIAGMDGMVAMAHIQAERIGACNEQRTNIVDATARRAEGCENADFTITRCDGLNHFNPSNIAIAPLWQQGGDNCMTQH